MIIQTSTTPFQDSIKVLNLTEGNKYTIFCISDWGMITTLKIKLTDIKYSSYAQYNDAVQIIGTPYKKRSVFGFWFYNNKDMVVYDGWLDYDESTLYTIKESNGCTVRHSKYRSCDNNALVAIVESLKQKPLYTLIHDYYKEYQIVNSEAYNTIKQYAEEHENKVPEIIINRYGLTPRHIKETFNNKYNVILYGDDF